MDTRYEKPIRKVRYIEHSITIDMNTINIQRIFVLQYIKNYAMPIKFGNMVLEFYDVSLYTRSYFIYVRETRVSRQYGTSCSPCHRITPFDTRSRQVLENVEHNLSLRIHTCRYARLTLLIATYIYK